MNYITFCKNYFSVTRIPVNLITTHEVLYSTLGDLLGVHASSPVEIWPAEHNPEFRFLSPDIVYGSVQIEATGEFVMIGPVFSIPVTDELIREYMRQQTAPLEYKEAIAELLASIPRLSHAQFCQHLIFLHQCLNHKEISMHNLINTNILGNQISDEQQLRTITENKENEQLHNSYYFELTLYQYIKNGNVSALNDFLSSSSIVLNEGKLAQTPLRHTKNLFIKAASKIGILGAIPGGIDIETTYQLLDLYILECEKLQSIEAIKTLQYSMIMDFCQRASEVRIPDGISSEIYNCINYIRSHTNEPISVSDVAEQIHRSSSYIMKKFKEELGFTIGAFITRCKLEEAKRLLSHSDKSLAEISNYLCFSSQPHFQNLFKKKYHMTPLEYRKQNSKAKPKQYL